MTPLKDTKQKMRPKLSKKNHLSVEKGACVRLRATGSCGGGDMFSTSSITVLRRPRQPRELGGSLLKTSKILQDPGNNSTNTNIRRASYDNTSLSKRIVQDENKKVKSLWITSLGAVLGRMHDVFAYPFNFYISKISLVAILFSFSVLLLPVSTVQAQAGPFFPFPEYFFVDDGTGPNITNIQTEFIKTGMLTKTLALRISWQTDVPANSVVEYATRTQYLVASSSNVYPFTSFMENSAYTTTHNITLQNLIPNEVYYYQIRGAN